MKKRQPAFKVEDQVCPIGYRVQPRSRPPDAKEFYADGQQTTPRRKVSYIPGEPLREEPLELPRLFTRGLHGGSFKMDLLGFGIGLSQAAFAYWVPDESFKDLHRGDIAIIDPARPFRTGDLVLAEIDGQPVLRRLRNRRRVWFLETANGVSGESGTGTMPLQDRPVQGVVLGILRLFSKVTPVRYRGTKANFSPFLERSSRIQDMVRHKQAPAAINPSRIVRYPRQKSASFLLATGPNKPYASPKAGKKTR